MTRLKRMTLLGVWFGASALLVNPKAWCSRGDSDDGYSDKTGYTGTADGTDAKYTLIDVSDNGHDKGELAEKPNKVSKKHLGNKDPDSTYLLDEMDDKAEVAKN